MVALKEDDLLVGAQLVSSAAALLNWHASARFSSVDGSPTKPIRAGWARVNPVSGHEEFPRIDPAVICLVHDGGDRAVLARQTVWPERMFSLLAGFVEAGESFETCVLREIREEIGLTVRDVRYLGSQPWPFPHQLMVGFMARYAGGNPNGSVGDIAGVRNERGNVFGLMPHPEHAVDVLTGSTDGLKIFESMRAYVGDPVLG